MEFSKFSKKGILPAVGIFVLYLIKISKYFRKKLHRRLGSEHAFELPIKYFSQLQRSIQERFESKKECFLQWVIFLSILK